MSFVPRSNRARDKEPSGALRSQYMYNAIGICRHRHRHSAAHPPYLRLFLHHHPPRANHRPRPIYDWPGIDHRAPEHEREIAFGWVSKEHDGLRKISAAAAKVLRYHVSLSGNLAMRAYTSSFCDLPARRRWTKTSFQSEEVIASYAISISSIGLNKECR